MERKKKRKKKKKQKGKKNKKERGKEKEKEKEKGFNEDEGRRRSTKQCPLQSSFFPSKNKIRMVTIARCPSVGLSVVVSVALELTRKNNEDE